MDADAARAALWGWEWNFLSLDVTGAVALLSSAGYGPIPPQVLAERPLVERAVSELAALPKTGQARDRRIADRCSGDYSDWFRISECGLFAYDWGVWGGPYEIVSAPSVPIHASALPSAVREAAALLALPWSFSDRARLDLT